jgi:hypothetical protein
MTHNFNHPYVTGPPRDTPIDPLVPVVLHTRDDFIRFVEAAGITVFVEEREFVLENVVEEPLDRTPLWRVIDAAEGAAGDALGDDEPCV